MKKISKQNWRHFFLTSGRKTLLSLLISSLIFLFSLLFFFSSGFKFFEVKFYKPCVENSIKFQLKKISDNFEIYYDELNLQFSEFMKNLSTISFMEQNSQDELIIEREKNLGQLFEKNSGLLGVRLIENDGIHLHYSSFLGDIFSQTETEISYKNYSDLNDLDYSLFKTQISQNQQILQNTENLDEIPKSDDEEKNANFLYLDSQKNQMLFVYPLYDKMDAFRGNFIFYVDADDFTRFLVSKNIIPFNTPLSVVCPKGIVFGRLNVGKNYVLNQIQSKWERKLFNLEQIAQSEDENLNLYILSFTENPHLFFAWLCQESDFEISNYEKILLLMILFVIIFLTTVLIFNLKQDYAHVIQNRIKKFQYSLLKEYIEHKDSIDWKKLSKEIVRRKYDIYNDAKKSFGRSSKKHSKEIDELLEKSWNEIILTFSGGIQFCAENQQKSENNFEGKNENLVVEDDGGLEELNDEDFKDEELEEFQEFSDNKNNKLEQNLNAENFCRQNQNEKNLKSENSDAEDLEELETLDDCEENFCQEKDEIVEETLEEFLENSFPQKEQVKEDKSESKENLKNEFEKKFDVAGLDFSVLDEESLDDFGNSKVLSKISEENKNSENNN